MSEPRDATRVTAAANAAVRKALPFGDTQDFDDVNRGLIASLPDGGVIKNAGGRVVWDLSKYSFVLDQDAPATVNPSLWRQTQLMAVGGLFQVTDRVYQVRSADLSNVDIIEGETLRLINKGHTAAEIAEMLQFPPELDQLWHLRGYYGTVSHDLKSGYNLYMGWFDMNPAHLHPLLPAEASTRYVEYMGGAAAVLARARKDMEGGQYRWVAEAVNHVVFADPGNTEARDLLADCFEQLGYQAEAGTWRNIYLTGAQELRDGIKKVATPTAVSPELLAALPIEMIFDYLGVMLNGPRAAGTGQEHPAMTAAPVLLHEVLGVCAVAGQP